jgi:hypothetical protein
MGIGMGLSKRTPLLAIAALTMAFFAFGSTASARIDVGQLVDPTSSACSQNNTWLQTVSPNNRYVVPEAGVITQWSFQGGAFVPTQMRLKVGRPAGGNDYSIVGQSGFEVPVANSVNTFNTAVPVAAGDILGFYFVGSNFVDCSLPGAPGYQDSFANGDIQPGSSATFTAENGQLDIAAVLEPDCDSDGQGDETQDQNLSPCPPAPETTITKQPKDKTKKKTATFEFTANEPGATFECSLDGKVFAACTSPATFKVKKGKHTFQVRAKDAGNNVDGTPASDSWKVKKKKKKK